MDKKNFGKTLKEIRKKYNLTQKDLAKKYNVTYQAVSKWENNINMPDITLLKKMSEDFRVSMDELLDGEIKEKRVNYKIILCIALISFFVLIIIIYALTKDNDFEFKTLSSNCSSFNISGNISYNSAKSAIYITNIKYCGGDDLKEYNKIECKLYEKNNNIEKVISSYSVDEKNPIKLEDFLQKVTFSVDNYNCNNYNNLYLTINATSNDELITTYNIPLVLDKCPN